MDALNAAFLNLERAAAEAGRLLPAELPPALELQMLEAYGPARPHGCHAARRQRMASEWVGWLREMAACYSPAAPSDRRHHP